MSLFNAAKKVFGTAPKLKKRRFDPEKMSVEDITLPTVIKNMDTDKLPQFIQHEFSTYKSLGYVDMPLDQLKFPEYHSYQIGVILKYLKEDKVYFAPKADSLISSAATSLSKRNLHLKVFDIVYRYNEIVDKAMLKDELEKDIKWTPLEVSYLLRYASMENRSLTKK